MVMGLLGPFGAPALALAALVDGATGSTLMPARAAQWPTSVPAARGSCLLRGPPSAVLRGGASGARTATHTVRAGMATLSPGAAALNSQRAQHTVRRTHSGEASRSSVDAGVAVLDAVVVVVALLVVVESVVTDVVVFGVAKGMVSQGTKASSCCTRIRGFVPTCASRMREAARARCASADVPFLSKSRVFSAVLRDIS